MYILPDGQRTNNWDAYNKSWRNFLRKYAKALGFSIESIDGDAVTFGRQTMRGNGKAGLSSTLSVPKTFLLPAVWLWMEEVEKSRNLKFELNEIYASSEEDGEDSDEDDEPQD